MINMSSPTDLPAVAPKTRMTVTRVGHKIDDLHETVDTLHQEIEEIKIVLKNLVKLQLDVEETKKEGLDDFLDPAIG
jgi:regulator of replication initiation timing